MQRKREPFEWAANEPLSGWTWFGSGAPNCAEIPAGMDGARLAFVATDSNQATGLPNPAAAHDLYDVTGARVTLTHPAAGGRIVFFPVAIRAQGWIALRSETAGGVAAPQTVARAAAWLWPSVR